MNTEMLIPLTQSTLRTPKLAAEQLVNWSLKRDVLWTALALVAAVNTLLLVILLNISPPEQTNLPGYFDNPLALYILQTGLLVVYVHALYWTGRSLGGQGELADLLILTVWLLALGAAVRIAILAFSVILPPVAALMSVITFIWGIWIFLHFIRVGLQLPSFGHAIATLFIGAVGMIFGLALVLALISLLAQGVLSNV